MLRDCGLSWITLFKQVQSKSYNMTCVSSKYSDQPVHSHNMARVFVYPALDNPEAVEGTCDQLRL